MECLFKESLIDLYGEDVIIRFINDNNVDEIYEMYDNLLKDDTRFSNSSLYAFENYLIKYYDSMDNPDIKFKFQAIIDKLYETISRSNISNIDELIRVSNLFRSTLTRQDILAKFASKKQKEEILKTKQVMAYFSYRIAKKYDIYFERKISLISQDKVYVSDEELKKYELSFSEKKLLINFFFILKKLPSKYMEWAIQTQERLFVDLISEPYYNSFNSYEKEFLTLYVINNFFVLEDLGRPESSFVRDDDNPYTGAYASGDYFIDINLSSNLNMTNLDTVHVVCHECEHLYQSKKSKSEFLNNTLGYYYLMYKLPRLFPQEENNAQKEYDDNYEYIEIETDAEKTAYFKLRAILPNLYKKYGLNTEKLEYRIAKLAEIFNKRRPIFISRKVLAGKSVPVYHYNLTRLSQIISGHPELVSEYPMLTLIFNENGQLKDIQDILRQKLPTNQLVTDYILDCIYSNNLPDIKVRQYSSDEQINFIDNISNAFENELAKLHDFIKNPSYIYKKDASVSLVDDCNMILRLTKIIEANMEIIEDKNLKPRLFSKIKMLIRTYDENIDTINEKLTAPNINGSYKKITKVIVDRLRSLWNRNEIYKYNSLVELRKSYIIDNNLLDRNQEYINHLKESIGFDNPFWQYKIKDNLGQVVSLDEFLNTFVKTNMINGNILNYNRDEVSVDLLIKYFYKCYNTRLKTVSQKPTGKPM